MNTENSRKINRRVGKRRQQERRMIPHPFGSEAWLGEIKSLYLLWPKKDRRISSRRSDKRRHVERRYHRYSSLAARRYAYRTVDKMDQLLTQEERKMLNDFSTRTY